MDLLRKVWPLSFAVEKGDTKNFIIKLVIYAVAAIIFGVVFGLLGQIQFIGFLFSIVGTVLDLYCTAGIVFCVLHFIGVGAFK